MTAAPQMLHMLLRHGFLLVSRRFTLASACWFLCHWCCCCAPARLLLDAASYQPQRTLTSACARLR